MRVAVQSDIDELQELLAAKGTTWQAWEYKLHRGNIIIYSPVTPWDYKTGKYDRSRQRMGKHLRIVPVAQGPFGLEYMRHTERWSPIDVCVGDLRAIADFITEDPFGICHPLDPPDVDQPRLRRHPSSK
ncbi:MAG: hypothetical protein V3V86_08315 [Gammaproteobacteria bacterium]